MKLLYPLGLLILIAIPVLIVIYIIKNRYKEKTVSSSYVWELSRKFVKRKNPINTLADLLALILQCLAIAFLAISLSNPVLTFKGQAENEVFILDASASMAMTDQDGVTRLDRAKEEISKWAKDAVNGSTFTLIVSDSNPRYACTKISDYQVFESFLDRVKVDMSDSTLDAALGLAQTLASSNEGSEFVLFTDQTVEAGEDLEVYQVGEEETNRGILDLRYTYQDGTDPLLLLDADVISYSGDTSAQVEFTFGELSLGTVDAELKEGEVTTVQIQVPDPNGNFEDFTSIGARILGQDSLAADDEYFIYSTEDFDTTDILLVSNSPFYFEAAFRALDRNGMSIDVTTVSPSMYGGGVGYDIYIFDSYSPETLPMDGAVWLCNTGESIPYSGFYAQKEYSVDDPGIEASYADNEDDILYRELTRNLVKRDVTISTYMRYTLNSRFTTVITYDNLPFLFAGRNDFGQREVVFAFDLHNSDLPLLADFVTLTRNLVSYSHPSVLSEFTYSAGEEVVLSFPDNALRASMTTPSGDVDPLDARDLQTYTLDEVGTYTLNMDLVSGKTQTVELFSAFPQGERDPAVQDSTLRSISASSQESKADRIYDSILPVVIVAVVLLLTDWILYGHEQF